MPTLKACTICGAPTPRSRCAQHQDNRTTTQRGYGTHHQRLRRRLAPLIATGTVICWRCNQPIRPDDAWDVGHNDTNRTLYRGPEHRACNRGARTTYGGVEGQAPTAADSAEPLARNFLGG